MRSGRERLRRWRARPIGSMRRCWPSSLVVIWCRRCGCPIRGCVASVSVLERLPVPEPWQGTLQASLILIDSLDEQIDQLDRQLRTLGADL